jgi:hypothetical protein
MPKIEKELSVEEKLANLYKLQLYVSEIDRIKSLRGELPQEVEDMEREVEDLNNKISKFHEDIDNCHRKIQDMQEKISQAEDLIEQYTRQQDDVQNNKQYEFLTKEIEYQGLEIELANKRIRENLDQIALLEEKEANCHKEVEERRGDLETKKGELDEIIAETRNEEEVMREKAKKIENSMTDKNLMTTFTRIHRKAHNGLAIVPIERESCSGCFNKVTPQRQIDVKLRKKIIYCEYCGRILIDEELANQNEMRRRKKGLLASL